MCVCVCVCVYIILHIILDFPCGSDGREFICNARDLGSIPLLGKSPGEGKGYPLQYYGLENRKGYIIYGVTKSRTWLSDSLSYIILHTHTLSHTYRYIYIHIYIYIYIYIYKMEYYSTIRRKSFNLQQQGWI